MQWHGLHGSRCLLSLCGSKAGTKTCSFSARLEAFSTRRLRRRGAQGVPCPMQGGIRVGAGVPAAFLRLFWAPNLCSHSGSEARLWAQGLWKPASARILVWCPRWDQRGLVLCLWSAILSSLSLSSRTSLPGKLPEGPAAPRPRCTPLLHAFVSRARVCPGAGLQLGMHRSVCAGGRPAGAAQHFAKCSSCFHRNWSPPPSQIPVQPMLFAYWFDGR